MKFFTLSEIFFIKRKLFAAEGRLKTCLSSLDTKKSAGESTPKHLKIGRLLTIHI